MTIVAVIAAVWVLNALLAAANASRRGHRAGEYLIAGLISGPFATHASLTLPDLRPAEAPAVDEAEVLEIDAGPRDAAPLELEAGSSDPEQDAEAAWQRLMQEDGLTTAPVEDADPVLVEDIASETEEAAPVPVRIEDVEPIDADPVGVEDAELIVSEPADEADAGQVRSWETRVKRGDDAPAPKTVVELATAEAPQNEWRKARKDEPKKGGLLSGLRKKKEQDAEADEEAPRFRPLHEVLAERRLQPGDDVTADEVEAPVIAVPLQAVDVDLAPAEPVAVELEAEVEEVVEEVVEEPVERVLVQPEAPAAKVCASCGQPSFPDWYGLCAECGEPLFFEGDETVEVKLDKKARRRKDEADEQG